MALAAFATVVFGVDSSSSGGVIKRSYSLNPIVFHLFTSIIAMNMTSFYIDRLNTMIPP